MKNVIPCILFSALIVSCASDKEDEPVAPIAPVSVTSLTVQQSNNKQVVLKWKDLANNETGFKIERKTGSGVYSQVGVTAQDITQYTDNGLVPDSAYSYRVVAYNAAGNAGYSNEAAVIVYPAVKIGSALWLQQNLDVDHYRNGDLIPQVTDAAAWDTLTTGAWCYYKNNTAYGVIYAKLYNWYAVNDPRGLAPEGWHVATNTEWATLTTELGGTDLAGGPMKATERWSAPNEGATNSSGFTALGAGARIAQGTFYNMGIWGAWWTATNDRESVSFYRILYNNSTKSEGYHQVNTFGMSVRCVKD